MSECISVDQVVPDYEADDILNFFSCIDTALTLPQPTGFGRHVSSAPEKVDCQSRQTFDKQIYKSHLKSIYEPNRSTVSTLLCYKSAVRGSVPVVLSEDAKRCVLSSRANELVCRPYWRRFPYI